MENVTKQYKLSIFVRGVKKRCRKEERHLLNGGYLPLTVDHEFAKRCAKSKIMEEMRTIQPGAYCVLNYVEQTPRENGFFVETWKHFDKRHVHLSLCGVEQ